MKYIWILTFVFYKFGDTQGHKMNHLKSSRMLFNTKRLLPFHPERGPFGADWVGRWHQPQLIISDGGVTEMTMNFMNVSANSFPPTMTDTPIPTSSSSWVPPSPWTAHGGPVEGVWSQPRWFSSVHPHLYLSVVHCQGPAQTAARWLRSIRTRTSWHVSTIKRWLILPCTAPLVLSLIHAVIILRLTYLHYLHASATSQKHIKQLTPYYTAQFLSWPLHFLSPVNSQQFKDIFYESYFFHCYTSFLLLIILLFMFLVCMRQIPHNVQPFHLHGSK